MLREAKAKQNRGEPRRRWFRDEDFDLYVWYLADGAFAGFQLCYDKQNDEHAFTWFAGVATHHRVDDARGSMQTGRTPILVAGRSLEAATLCEAFDAASTKLDPEIRAYVLKILAEQ
jgi:hypothetical protein